MTIYKKIGDPPLNLPELTGKPIEGTTAVLYATVTHTERGITTDRKYFEDHNDALIATVGSGPWGSDLYVEPRFALKTSSGQWYLITAVEICILSEESHIEKLRAEALAKIDPLDRKLLGLE